MKRSGLSPETVAGWENLQAAFHRTALGKSQREEVVAFRANLDAELASLRRDLLVGQYQPLPMRSFCIRDPKPRIIHAPAFRDRVLHHALMHYVGPWLDRTLVFDTYACREGKGTLASVQRCRQHLRRYPWYCKIDIDGYFASIDHARLKALLRRQFKHPALLALIDRIIDSHQHTPGRGLPIGALTSQHFANVYLAGLDRLLLETCRVCGMVRYMDDIVWWGDSKDEVQGALARADDFLREQLGLRIKANVQINRSARGLSYCGYRILPGGLRLSRRKRRRYAERREYWESAFFAGDIDTHKLQAGYASVLAISAHADAAGWRREQLRRAPLDPRLEAV